MDRYWQINDHMEIWSDEIKWKFFQAVAVSVLQYGCTTCTLMKWLGKKKLDENSIRMFVYCFEQILEAASPTKQQLYSYLPPISQTIQVRQPRHAGH